MHALVMPSGFWTPLVFLVLRVCFMQGSVRLLPVVLLLQFAKTAQGFHGGGCRFGSLWLVLELSPDMWTFISKDLYLFSGSCTGLGSPCGPRMHLKKCMAAFKFMYHSHTKYRLS